MLRKFDSKDLDELFSLLGKNNSIQKQSLLLYNQIPPIQKIWQSVVGNELSVHSLPYKIEKKILHVRVDHAIYAQELQFNSPTIIKEIRRHLLLELSAIKTEVGMIYWATKVAKEHDALSAQSNLADESVNEVHVNELLQSIRNFQE